MDPRYSHAYSGHQPPRYVMLAENNMGFNPPPSRRNIPRYHSHKKSGCGLCGCLCWCCCFLLLILLVILASLAYVYMALDPKPPSYSVEHLGVSSFNVRSDFTLHTEISITVRAENPNKNIGIFYGHDSMVAVLYKDAIICSGKLPSFYQGHENTTSLKVVLKGDNTFGSGLHHALEENEKSNSIPLDIYVKVPVMLRAWSTNTNEVKVLVDCHLVVDSLKPSKKVAIKSADYKVNLQF